MPDTSEKDIVVEARAKLEKPGHGMGKRNRELINGLCDEVERLREELRIYRNDPTSADTEYGR